MRARYGALVHASVQELVLDCNDVEKVAGFWARLLGVTWAMVFDPGWAVLEVDGLRLAFQQVPEAKASPKNRLHLDLQVTDLVGAAAEAEALGATRASTLEDHADLTGFVVMRDPEGNEFCLVRDLAGRYAGAVARALS